MMAPPAKENLPPKKRKENRPPQEFQDLPLPTAPDNLELEQTPSPARSSPPVIADPGALADYYGGRGGRHRTIDQPTRLQPHLQYSIPIMLTKLSLNHHHHEPLALVLPYTPHMPRIPPTLQTSLIPPISPTSDAPNPPHTPKKPQTPAAAPVLQSQRKTGKEMRTKDIVVELELTDKEVQKLEEMSENQRKEFSSKKGFNADQDKRLRKIKTRMGNTKAAKKSRERKLKETEQLKQQVEEVKKRKMENLALRTKKFLSKESEIQIFNDYIKKILQRGDQVFCSGHHLLTDSCPACENCDLTIMRI